MPISADPNSTIPYVLITDRKKPPAEQTTFHLRFLTDCEVGRYERLAEQHDEAKDPDERAKLANEMIHAGVARWDRLFKWVKGTEKPELVPYSPAVDLTELLTPSEKFELVRAVRDEPFVKERDLKNSESPAPSGPASSVVTALPGASTAPPATPTPLN